ncbi:adhesion G protein-coupled receptor B1-like [Ptychodera flava]|uniref:adhesion G protein-coupled receptor B1-like n=1 Tax=Ptychodera flava TaxID=63121 RepID=UPI003969FE72
MTKFVNIVKCNTGNGHRRRLIFIKYIAFTDHIAYGKILAVFLDVQYVDGAWTSWSPWSQCSVTCGGTDSFQTRQRTCTNPEKFNCGNSCYGNSTETKSCGSYPCMGKWNAIFKAVSRVSGYVSDAIGELFMGTDVRNEGVAVAKALTNELQDHYKSIVLNYWESYNITEVCLVLYTDGYEQLRLLFNGTGSNKTDWFTGGRLLSHPWSDLVSSNEPNFNIDSAGSEQFFIGVNRTDCEHKKIWFYVEDNSGTHGCDYETPGPYPQFYYSVLSEGGHPTIQGETDNSTEVMAILVDVPQVDGGWNSWSAWTTCSVTCEGANTFQTRNRTCDDPIPADGGVSCDGDDQETRPCGRYPCTLHGNWSPWSNWAVCPITCEASNTTITYRTRDCTNPAPYNGGKECTGEHNQTKPCGSSPCPTNPCSIFFNESDPHYELKNKISAPFCHIANLTEGLTSDDVVESSSFLIGGYTPRSGDVYAVLTWLGYESAQPLLINIIDANYQLANYFTICGNLLDNTLISQWSEVRDYTRGPIQLLETCNSFALKAGEANIGQVEFYHRNIGLKIDFVNGNEFSQYENDMNEYGLIRVDSPASDDISDGSVISFLTVVYANSSQLFSTIPLQDQIVIRNNQSSIQGASLESNSMAIGTSILSFTMLVNGQSCSVPVEFILYNAFRADTDAYWSNPRCSFLDYSTRFYDDTSWSFHDCRTVTDTAQSTTCHCNHTTDFAVIMDILQQPVPSALRLQSVISICSSLSIIAISLTILSYLFVRMKIHDELRYIHINECIAILGINLCFMLGVDAWDKKVSCMAVSILLRVFWSSLFLWLIMEMCHFHKLWKQTRLCKDEKLNRSKDGPLKNTEKTSNVTKRASSRCKNARNVQGITCWGVPVVMIGGTAGVFPDMFDNGRNCWWYLEVEPFEYKYWLLIAPDLIVIIFITVFLVVVRVNLFKESNQYVSGGTKRCVGIFALLCAAYAAGLAAVNMTSLVELQYVYGGAVTAVGLIFFILHVLFKNEASSVIGPTSKISDDELAETFMIVMKKKTEPSYVKNKKDGYRNTDTDIIRERDDVDILDKLPGLVRSHDGVQNTNSEMTGEEDGSNIEKHDKVFPGIIFLLFGEIFFP